jgi:DNA repair protein RecO (recombination protein O)
VPLITTRAIVLHGIPYGESSRILRLLTRDQGSRSVIAKGAQRPKSRFGALLEPFTEGEAQFNLREGRDLFILTGFSLIRSRQGIGRDLGGFAAASLVAELALRHGTEEPFMELYDAVNLAFDDLASAKGAASCGLSHLWSVVGVLGYRPEMQHCVQCARPLAADEPSRFDLEAGGAACRACRPTGRILPGTMRADVDRMSTRDPRGSEWNRDHAQVHGALLEAFLSTHLGADRPFRSIPLFREYLR